VCRFHVATGWRRANKKSLTAPLLECHTASGHHLLEYCLFPPRRLNLGFITEGKLAAIFIKPSLGVSNCPVIYFINYTPTSFLAPSSLRHQWYVQNVSTFPNPFTVVFPLIYVFWIQLTCTNAVFSGIALVSCFYAEIQLSVPENIAKLLFYEKTHRARRRDRDEPQGAHTTWPHGPS
jgi:hypothetical protein